jgi:C-terminal processing protease CtpA/Prc
MEEAEQGVRVQHVVPGSPAEKAGIQENDVIVSVDRNKVSDARDIRDVVRNMDEPHEMQIEVQRDGRPVTVTVTPEKRDFAMLSVMGNRMYMGVNLQELNPDLAAYFQVDPNAGVLITSVEPDSPAAKAGLRSGDVITHINGNKVNQSSDVVSQLGDSEEGKQLEVTVLRHGSEQKMIVIPEQRSWGHPEIPAMPELRQMLRDNPKFEEDMQNLRDEMENLKNDMQLRKEDLQKMKQEIQEKIREEMDKLRQELKKKPL